MLTVIARHEMGHVLGLGHTGHHVDYTTEGIDPSESPGSLATMHTCPDGWDQDAQDEFTEDAVLGQDDAASLAHIHDDQSIKPLHANGSFENSSVREYWYKSAGSWGKITGDANDDGLQHLWWKAATSADKLSTTSAYVYGQDAADNPYIDARINVRRDSSTDSGSFRMQVRARKIRFPAPQSASCEDIAFASGRDETVRITGQQWQILDEEIDFTTIPVAWTTYTTTSEQLADTSDWYGADLQIIVNSTAQTSGGDDARLHVDNTRVRDRWDLN
jgi:hypothetical protein